MGMIIGSTADLETIAKLDAAFTQNQLTKLRNHGELLFDGNHTLSRVSHRLGAYPSGVSGKWFALLDSFRGQSVETKIKNCLIRALNERDAKGNYKYNEVKFGVIAVSSTNPYDVDCDTSQAPLMVLTLLCNGNYSGGSNPSNPPNDTDGGGNNIEQPPIYLGP